MNLHRISFVMVMAATAAVASADAPSGYYSVCEGKTEKALLQSLHTVIDGHTVIGYDNLYTVYDKSDRHPDGTIWDMYSTKNWGTSFNSVKCGNYSKVGDCINKEHSFPKSWFDDRSPMVSDAFHIYPTDGKVNGQRSNFPYGECANGTYLAANGSVKPLGRLGTSTFPGYSGKVFEPDDQYKGDFARTYFYMAARYNDKISTWDSPMLASNNYPCFSSWALELLLKWHREDPVSQKELDRNDAVYGFQKNRNPFIDHPELAEYIWGNRKGDPWSATLTADPTFTFPVANTTFDLGLTAAGYTLTRQMTVKGINIDRNATVTVSGTGFSATPATLQATEINGQGAMLTVSYNAAVAGKGNGKIVITAGTASVTVNLLAEAVDGLPVLPPTYITAEGFTANWVSIDPAGTKYTLDVRRDNVSVDGFPLQVDAAAGSYEVEGLEPETEYTYTVANASMTSKSVSVMTAALVPSVTFYYDDELTFTSVPGEPSSIAEIIADIENIPSDVTISVTAPFQLSLDKQNWSTSVVLSPGADRFYMRLYTNGEGAFSTSLVASADGYFNDDVEVSGIVAEAGASFIEDFEKQIPAGQGNGYGALTYVGNACTWSTDQVYFEYAGSNSYPHSGSQAVRFGKIGNRHITMLEDKQGGIGNISFWARPWGKDSGDCTFDVSVSSDHGQSWSKVGTVTVKANGGSDNVYAEYSVAANRAGSLRVKVEQTGGQRCMLDDLALGNYSSSVAVTPEGHLYHSWDAYCLNGELVIENSDPANEFAVYSIDGREVFVGKVNASSLHLALPAGLYLVNVRDFSRNVLVKGL